MSKKMTIVTGLRRSGTSMMMYALKEAGLNIAGDKWCKGNGGSVKEANPDGYWEVGKVTTEEGLNRKTMLALKMGDVIKVMFEALPKCTPNMVGKVIVMTREPGKVVTSFLKHNRIERVDLFILNYCLDVIDSIEYLEDYDKEYMVVCYDDLVEDHESMKEVIEFIGKGKVDRAINAIKPKLNRSTNDKYPELGYLKKIHQYLIDGKIDKVLGMRNKIDKRAYKLLNK